MSKKRHVPHRVSPPQYIIGELSSLLTMDRNAATASKFRFLVHTIRHMDLGARHDEVRAALEVTMKHLRVTRSKLFTRADIARCNSAFDALKQLPPTPQKLHADHGHTGHYHDHGHHTGVIDGKPPIGGVHAPVSNVGAELQTT